MSDLDILTPKGRVTVAEEQGAVMIFERHFPEFTYISTPKSTIAIVDAVIVRGDQLVGVAETKCRQCSFETFQSRFDNEWLVTDAKIRGGADVADKLQVPFWGMLFLVPSAVLLVQRLYQPGKGWLVRMETRRTETQATVNGGKANRENAFIDMSRALILRP